MNVLIHDNIWIIDDVLCSIISPSEKTFSEEKLIIDFDYPQVDLT